MKRTKKTVSVIVAITVATSLLVGCGGSGDSGATTVIETKTTETTVVRVETKAVQVETVEATAAGGDLAAGKKVAYIMLLPFATIFQIWKDSYISPYDALDIELDFFFCNNDLSKWQNVTRACASVGYDGLLVNHDNQDGSHVFLKETTEQYPDLEIATFDTQFYANSEYQKFPGVTRMFQ